MATSAANPRREPTPPPERAGLDWLEREEERTLAELQGALLTAGEDLLALEEVRAWVRAHPRLALGAGTALGVLLAPAVARSARVALSIGASRWGRALASGIRPL